MTSGPRNAEPAPEPVRRVERDLTTREGAELLARELDAFWHTRGYTQVAHTVLPIAGSRQRIDGHTVAKDLAIWVVRSNLVGGLPPREGA